MFKIILLLVLFIIFVITILIIRQPNSFRYARSSTMNAGPAKIFEQVNDLHKWEGWSPWAKLDPEAKTIYSGPDTGVGAVFEWDGNKNVGAGKMTILESRPHEFIKLQLDFLRPFKATNISEFTFTPEGSQTVVTWSMYGKNNITGKLISIFVNCERMVGDMFSKGLASLKAIVE
jgi:hypothetical protein